MGAGTSGSWFSFSSQEVTLVLLRLHDSRNLGNAPGEEVFGLVRLGPDPEEAARLRADCPAQFAVGAGTTVRVAFQAASREPRAGRILGEVLLPLEHIARRCGGSLYHMWLPVQASSCGSSSAPGEEITAEQVDRALRSAARDPRQPIVCLSLCQADGPHADKELYDTSATSDDKATRFWSLLQSHAQHARLLQALYRQSRSAQQSRGEAPLPPNARDGLGLDMTLGPARQPPAGRQESLPLNFDLPGPAEVLNPGEDTYFDGEEAERLREEIELTATEASARIQQASEAIRTLKERLADRQAEHEQLQQETARLRREAVELEIENERLALRQERHASPLGGGGLAGPGAAAADDREEEVRRLRREAEVLAEQKEALLLILDDLYGATGGTPHVVPPADQGAPVVAAAGLAGEPLGTPGAGEQTWTNMLPRPSELFASGVLDDP